MPGVRWELRRNRRRGRRGYIGPGRSLAGQEFPSASAELCPVVPASLERTRVECGQSIARQGRTRARQSDPSLGRTTHHGFVVNGVDWKLGIVGFQLLSRICTYFDYTVGKYQRELILAHYIFRSIWPTDSRQHRYLFLLFQNHCQVV